LHGCGYGDDGPLFTTKTVSRGARELTIEKNNALIWKPMALSSDGKYQFTFGGPLIVTDNGCESLFKREHGMVSVL
jgi:hypothetical protein